MQLSRLFEIVYILLRDGLATAAALAERFEVSVRTIYRDVEALTQAGIPIYAQKGRGGGLRLMEGFVLNRSLLSGEEQRQILSALQAMRATKYEDSDATLTKLSGLFGQGGSEWIKIDLSDWSGTRNALFEQLKEAIHKKQLISFTYHNSAGQTGERTAYPLQLWFKHRTWYLHAYCPEKQGMRLFRITRMRQLKLQDQYIDSEINYDVPAQSSPPLGGSALPYQQFVFRIAAELAYRVYDEFDESQVQRDDDGDFLVTMSCPEDAWVYGFILSFGPSLEVLHPQHVRENVRDLIKKMAENYQI